MRSEETDNPIVFEIGGALYPLERGRATYLAESLRIRASVYIEEYGVTGARAVADLIEDVLTDRWSVPIPLEGEAVEAVFYQLNIDQEVYKNEEKRLLYNAVAAAHCDLIGIPRVAVPPPEERGEDHPSPSSP
jgi:hypothetical protein